MRQPNEMKQASLTLSTYRPNFADPRVRERITAVLDFCMPLVLQKKAKPVSSAVLTKAFGNQSSNQLSKYLRYKLLQQESAHQAGKRSIAYSVKRDGYAELEAAIGRTHRKDREIAVEVYGAIAAGLKQPEYTEPTVGARRYHPVQNLPKSLRAELFKGWFDYDIEAAAPTLVYQEACRVYRDLHRDERDMADAPFPSIAKLVNDKIAVREHVSRIVELPVDVAKEIVVALFFGARLVPNNKLAIYRMLRGDGGRLAALKQDSFVASFCREAKRMWSLLVLDENHRNGLSAFKGGPVIPKPATKGKQRMGIYLRLERKVVDVIEVALESKGNRIVLIHDGFMSMEQVDVGWLEALVRDRTGFEVRLSRKKLGPSSEVDDELDEGTSESIADEFGEDGELD